MRPTEPYIEQIIKGIRINMEGSEELLPTFFLVNDEGTHIVATPFTDAGASKDNAAAAVRKIATEIKAHTIVFLSETWTLVISEEEKKDFDKIRKKWPSIADHPDAKEMVVLNIETATSMQNGMAEILPGRKLGEFVWTPPTNESEGRFANLLGPKPALQ